MTTRAKNGFTSFSAAAIALVVASVAWACTAVPSCSGSPDSGSMGTRVSINCIGFQREAPVEIRWNSAEGPVVGSTVTSARDGSFSVAIAPPADAAADVHYLMAIQRAPDGTIMAKASDTFELTTSSGARTAERSALGDNWSGFSGHTSASAEVSSSPLEARRGSENLALGVALLAVGAAMMGAAALVTLRKRQGAHR